MDTEENRCLGVTHNCNREPTPNLFVGEGPRIGGAGEKMDWAWVYGVNGVASPASMRNENCALQQYWYSL